jgi:ribonuclease Z
VLIHESTYTDDVANKVGKGPQHSSAKMIAQFANEASIRHLILTHFSPRYQDKDKGSPSIDDIEKEAKKYYTGNLFLANDLDIFYLNTDGELHKSNLR